MKLEIDGEWVCLLCVHYPPTIDLHTTTYYVLRKGHLMKDNYARIIFVAFNCSSLVPRGWARDYNCSWMRQRAIRSSLRRS